MLKDKNKNFDNETWLRRLNLFLSIEKKLIMANRIKNINLLIITFSLFFSWFSLYNSPTLITGLFVCFAVLSLLSLIIYPFLVLFTLFIQKQRNLISSFFYKENYEIDIIDKKIYLINKSNYKTIIELNTFD